MAKATEPTRRRAPRIRAQLEGSLVGRSPHAVAVLDLSLTGCLLRCDTLLDHGAIFDLRVELDGDPFSAKVRVADASLDGACAPGEARRYLTGLEFLGLSAREETRLRRFLDEARRRRRSP